MAMRPASIGLIKCGSPSDRDLRLQAEPIVSKCRRQHEARHKSIRKTLGCSYLLLGYEVSWQARRADWFKAPLVFDGELVDVPQSRHRTSRTCRRLPHSCA